MDIEGRLIYMRWPKPHGWCLGKVTQMFTMQDKPRLFKKFNFRIKYEDGRWYWAIVDAYSARLSKAHVTLTDGDLSVTGNVALTGSLTQAYNDHAQHTITETQSPAGPVTVAIVGVKLDRAHRLQPKACGDLPAVVHNL